MAYHEEDIFGDSSIEVILRFHQKAITEFDKRNDRTFTQLKEKLQNIETETFFQKVKDGEHKITIPIKEFDGYWEVYGIWDAKTFSYKAKVHKAKKTLFKLGTPTFNKDDFAISEPCTFHIIDINDSQFPSSDFVELEKRVEELEIPPKARIENELEVWDKYIEAQEKIIKANAEPFEVVSYYTPKAVGESKENPLRYRFEVELKKERTNEYREVEKELNSEFRIEDKFDIEGNIFLKSDDIYRGLDAVIEKKFEGIIERENDIAVILKIRPLFLHQKIKSVLDNLGWNLFTSGDLDKKHIYFFQNTTKEIRLPKKEVIDYYQLRRIGIIGKYRVEDEHGNEIVYPPEIIYFKRHIYGRWLEEEKKYLKQKLIETRRKLFDEGMKNVRFNFGEIYESKIAHIEAFTTDFWINIRRDFYNFDFEIDINENSGSISFEVKNQKECFDKIDKIEGLNKFSLIFSPKRPDFKYKVKTNIVAKKSKRDRFLEKLKALNRADFLTEVILKDKEQEENAQIVSKKQKTNKTIKLFIGNLSGRDSNMSKLVFTIPNKWKQEKKLAQSFLKCISQKPSISTVYADLRGDLVKTKWLREAMGKVANPTNRPNGKAVNEKLAEFIFDSSKAQEIFKNITPDSEEWQFLKQHELLTLNDSQRSAILKAVHAPDLCLLQGPPGTGKTTVIAEIIWQMILRNHSQKILLTSETNLAVDNALEKLLNPHHTLVKPLRFGRETKFEEEGKKYSYNRIMKWIDADYEVEENYKKEVITGDGEEEEEEEILLENESNNAVQIWMNRIANNAKHQESKYTEVLKDWTLKMSMPDKEMKVVFKDKYLKYANVVGSTCSSSGSGLFKRDYARTFYPEIKNSKPVKELIFLFENRPNSRKIWDLLEEVGYNIDSVYSSDFEEIASYLKKSQTLTFDTVIMDEASKATPPELLLPLCYGKKSVIIGDHRQLPPMLHNKDFKETLEEIDAFELAKEIDEDFTGTSIFERLIENPKVSPTIKATFHEQYRMHSDINSVIDQFYINEGGLRPGIPILEHQDDPNLNNPFSRFHGFLNQGFINPDIHTIWVNVDEPEEKSGTSRINVGEVKAVKSVLQYLRNSENFEAFQNHWSSLRDEDKRRQEQEIGIISFYFHQLKKLREVTKYAKNNLDIPVRLKTVDKFQGMERNIIIVSTVRSNKILQGGQIRQNRDIGFAKAPERLNVALSRARRLLIVVGNLDFFYNYKDPNGNTIYRNAIDMIKKNGKIIKDYKLLNKYNQ